jgi:hypothetical protein
MKLPETMRAMVLTGHGGLDKLVYHEDWPMPTPASGEVLVRVAACGLNNTDINTRTAWYSKSVTESITDTGGKKGAAGHHARPGQPDQTGFAQTAAGAIFSAQGVRQGAGDVHAEAARRQYRHRNMNIKI